MPRSGPARVGYAPTVPGAVRAEVQRLDPAHPVRGWGEHVHTDFFELVVFDRPGGRHLVEGSAHDVVPGQVVAVGPGVVHDLGRLGAGSGWVVVFTPESAGLELTTAAAGLGYAAEPLLAPFTGGPAGNPVTLTPAEFDHWRYLLSRMTGEQAAPDPQQGLALRSLLNLLLVEASRVFPSRAVDLRVVPLLEQVFDVIERRYRSGLGLREVAAVLHRSPAHLTAVVRRATGRPVGEWIIQRRMVEARRRLLNTDATVRQVAAEAGYTDVALFVRQFRDRHGFPPGAWRASARHAGSPEPAR